MRKKYYTVAGLILISGWIMFSSCQNSTSTNPDGSLSTDVVNNPLSANGSDTANLPKFAFEKDTHDFGSIEQGEKVAYSFKFKNSGKSDLIISNAHGSCGCTVPNWPKQPVKPGDEATIDVTFDSAGKSGKQTKTVTLIANTIPNTTVLTIVGEVKTKENNQ